MSKRLDENKFMYQLQNHNTYYSLHIIAQSESDSLFPSIKPNRLKRFLKKNFGKESFSSDIKNLGILNFEQKNFFPGFKNKIPRDVPPPVIIDGISSEEISKIIKDEPLLKRFLEFLIKTKLQVNVHFKLPPLDLGMIIPERLAEQLGALVISMETFFETITAGVTLIFISAESLVAIPGLAYSAISVIQLLNSSVPLDAKVYYQLALLTSTCSVFLILNGIDDVGRLGKMVTSTKKIFVLSRGLISLGAGHLLYQAASTSSNLALANDTSIFARDIIIPTLTHVNVANLFKSIDQGVVILNAPVTFILANGSMVLAGPIFHKPRSLILRQVEKLPFMKNFLEQYLPQIGIAAPFPAGMRGGVPGDRIYPASQNVIKGPNVPKVDPAFIPSKPLIVTPNTPIQEYLPPPPL
jgi:hypothetical protein